MKSITIKNHTRSLGAPQGWDHRNQSCHALTIRDEILSNHDVMVSAWLPSPEELKLLNAGKPLLLTVVGSVHPPVSLNVQHD